MGWALLPSDPAAPGADCASVAAGWLSLLSAHARFALWATPPSALFGHWLTMLLAMMPLMLWRPMTRLLKDGAAREAVASWTAGYSLVWLAAGLPVLVLVVAACSLAAAIGVPAICLGFAAALLWQLSPHRAKALAACGQTGSRPAQPPFLAGVRLGGLCLLACGPWMLAAMLATAHSRLLMVLVMGLLLAEREISARGAGSPRRSFKPSLVGGSDGR